MADIAPVDTALSCDGTNDGPRLDSVLLTDLHAVAGARPGRGASPRPPASSVGTALDRAILVPSGFERRSDKLTGLVQALLTTDFARAAAVLLDPRGRPLVADGTRHKRSGDVLDARLLAELRQKPPVHVQTPTLDARPDALQETPRTKL